MHPSTRCLTPEVPQLYTGWSLVKCSWSWPHPDVAGSPPTPTPTPPTHLLSKAWLLFTGLLGTRAGTPAPASLRAGQAAALGFASLMVTWCWPWRSWAYSVQQGSFPVSAGGPQGWLRGPCGQLSGHICLTATSFLSTAPAARPEPTLHPAPR